jgi:glutathione S-transferase
MHWIHWEAFQSKPLSAGALAELDAHLTKHKAFASINPSAQPRPVTAADVAIFASVNIAVTGVKESTLKPLSALSTWYAALFARPAFANAIKQATDAVRFDIICLLFSNA